MALDDKLRTGAFAQAQAATRSFNIRDYGAAGDVTTDDTAAIQLAISAMNQSNSTYPGELFIPAGIYKISSTLTLPSSTGGIVRGEGASSVLTAANGLNANMIASSGDRWTFKNFQLRGNSSNNTSGSGIVTTGTGYNWFENLWIQNTKEDGIKLNDGGSNRVVGVQCKDVQQYGINVVAGSFDNELIGVLVGSSGSHNIYIDASPTRLTNCHVYSSVAGQGVYVAANRTLIQFVNCDFESNNQRGILFAGTHQGCSVIGGRFWNNQLNGIFGTGMQNCSFVGATFYNNGQGTNATGITGADSFDCSVTACQFYDTQGASKTQTYAVQTSGTSDRWVFTGNSMRATQLRTGSTLLVNAANVIATDNLT